MAKQTIEAVQFLQAAYSEPGRYYHDLNHIKFLLSKLAEWVNKNAGSCDERVYKLTREAIWWHDVWYSIWDAHGINEIESSLIFKNFANTGKVTGLSDEDISIIVNAILTTQHHLATQTFLINSIESQVTQLMLDIDLSGFAKNYEGVKYDSENVIKEYTPIGHTRLDLLKERIAFLDKLLCRERIFYTDYFYDTHECLARDNINKLKLDTLQEISGIN